MTGDRFDDLWDRYEEMDSDISEQLGLDPIADADRKERARELWEDGRLIFAGLVPIVTSNGVEEP